MRKRLSVLSLVTVGMLSTLLVFGTIAQACPSGSKGKAQKCKIGQLKKNAKMLWLHKDHLKLTDEQLDQIKDIKHSAIKDIIRLKADIDVTKVDIKSEMWMEQIETGKVNKLIDQKYASKNNIAKTYVKALADMQKVLDDDQRAKWREIRIWKKMSSSCGGQCGGVCDMCSAKSSCPMCIKAGGTCMKCSKSKGGICPLTGKPLSQGKGSMKGSL